jgi:hypothetical protein
MATNFAEPEGLTSLICEMRGVILEALRPTRTMRAGKARESERAVSAPIPPILGPVITTDSVRICGAELQGTYLSFP